MKKTLIALMILAVSAGASLAERGEEGKNWKRGGRDGGMRKEMKTEMRAQMKALKQMGQDIQAETDEAKKAEMTAELRAKVGELIDARAKKQEERLAKAEEKLAKLKSKVEEFKSNRDDMIDEKVDRFLSCKRSERGGDGEGWRSRDGKGRGDGKSRRGSGMGGGPRDGSGPGCDKDDSASDEAPASE
jgi:predicted RNase H-like nuclease (RuvC/YqgF family)